jgi:hypothetical protein
MVSQPRRPKSNSHSRENLRSVSCITFVGISGKRHEVALGAGQYGGLIACGLREPGGKRRLGLG